MTCEKRKAIRKFRSTTGLSSFARSRQRGSLLLDGVLALTIVAGVIGLSASIIAEENRRQEEAITAMTLRQISVASQNFVAENYDSLRLEMFTIAQSDGLAQLPVDMGRLSAAGYLPPILVDGDGNLSNLFRQNHTILIRGVNRNDAGNPQATMTLADLDPASSGSISPALLDRDPDNGEYEIEAVLVSSGGDAIPPHRGGPIVTRTELPTVGFVTVEDRASGAYGNFSLDMTEYQNFPEEFYPGIGHFVAIVAMSNFGVLNVGEGNEADLSPAFLRCADIDPVLDASAFNQCLENSDNAVFSNLVFNTYTNSSGDTVFPGIRGLTNVACDNADPTETLATGRLLIDCSVTDMTGDLNVATNVTVGDEAGDHVEITPTSIQNGDMALNQQSLTVDGTGVIELLPEPGVPGSEEIRMTADRVMMNGKDLNEVILDTRVVLAGQTVDKPTCPFDITGTPMEPEVYATPIAYADARGRNIVGVRVATEDQGSNWLVRMFNFIEEDFCASLSGSALIPIQASGPFYGNGAPDDPNCTEFTETPAGSDNWVVSGTSRSDTLVDVYEISPEYGASLVQTRCVAQ